MTAARYKRPSRFRVGVLNPLITIMVRRDGWQPRGSPAHPASAGPQERACGWQAGQQG